MNFSDKMNIDDCSINMWCCQCDNLSKEHCECLCKRVKAKLV